MLKDGEGGCRWVQVGKENGSGSREKRDARVELGFCRADAKTRLADSADSAAYSSHGDALIVVASIHLGKHTAA